MDECTALSFLTKPPKRRCKIFAFRQSGSDKEKKTLGRERRAVSNKHVVRWGRLLVVNTTSASEVGLWRPDRYTKGSETYKTDAKSVGRHKYLYYVSNSYIYLFVHIANSLASRLLFFPLQSDVY